MDDMYTIRDHKSRMADVIVSSEGSRTRELVLVGVAHGLLELGPAAIPKRLSSSVHQHRNIITAHTPHHTNPSTSSPSIY
jgi:hypothetical protein